MDTKTTLIADSCYLAKKGDDLYDVEKFLEASETILQNKMEKVEIGSSLWIRLKQARVGVMSTRGTVIAAISYDKNIAEHIIKEDINKKVKKFR